MSDPNDALLFDPFIRRMETAALKLDIGSGGAEFERKDDTWTTVDRYAPANVAADMWDLPYADESVDSIWSSHSLEHVPIKTVTPTLREWHRVLRPGGDVTVLVPDFDYVATLWLEIGPQALGHVFGNQEHEGEFHKMAWTLDSLQADLVNCGFVIERATSTLTPEYTQYSLWVEGRKP